MFVFVCVRACVSACRVYAVRIVSTDKISRFIKFYFNSCYYYHFFFIIIIISVCARAVTATLVWQSYHGARGEN